MFSRFFSSKSKFLIFPHCGIFFCDGISICRRPTNQSIVHYLLYIWDPHIGMIETLCNNSKKYIAMHFTHIFYHKTNEVRHSTYDVLAQCGNFRNFLLLKCYLRAIMQKYTKIKLLVLMAKNGSFSNLCIYDALKFFT